MWLALKQYSKTCYLKWISRYMKMIHLQTAIIYLRVRMGVVDI